MKLNYIGGVNGKSKLEWFWDFNIRLLKLLESKGFDIELAEKANSKNQSGWPQHNLYGHKTSFNPNSTLISNPKTEKCLIFSTYFDLRQLTGGYSDIPREQLVVLHSGHYDQKIIDRDVREDIRHKVKPWYFRPWNWETLYPENCYKPQNESIYFRGLYISTVRNLVKRLEDCGIKGIDIKGSKEKDYKTKMCEAKLCFSMSGIRDMCNRDIEYWRAGIPFIRPRFTSKLIVDIPDDVYFPVEWEPSYETVTPIPKDLDKLKESVIEKYQEIKDNTNLLKKVGANGYNFYKKYFTTEKIVENSFKLIEQSGILDQ